MKVGVFITENNHEHDKMLTAFAKGLCATGIEPIISNVNNYVDVDIAVIFGVYKKSVPISFARGEIMRKQTEANRLTIVIEKGFIDRDEYYMVGMNGLNNRAYFNNDDCDDLRWNQLDKKIKQMNLNGKNIVICGQVPSDASVQAVDIVDWYGLLIKQIRDISQRPIVFRPHPLALNTTPEFIGTTRSHKTLQEDFDDAYCVVTYNSNTAVDAVIAGVPVVAFDCGSMVWDICGKSVNSIEFPLIPFAKDIDQWANNIAYAQWNIDEFRQGLPFTHLMQVLKQEIVL